MKILIFDTETTNLIPKNAKLPDDYEKYPHIVQIAWLVQDERALKLFEGNYIIRPVGYTIPQESTDIHRITTQGAIKTGVSLKYVLRHLISDVQNCDLMVGHNIGFDIDIIKANLLKLEVPTDKINKIIDDKPKLCTMKETTNYCNLPSPYGPYPKYPKLEELHKKLFKEEMAGCHDASVDVQFTAKCFYELIKLNIIKL